VAKTKKFRFHFQPRPEQAMVIVGMTSQYFDARAWIGVERAEFNIQRTFDKSGTRLMFNYYAEEGRYLAVADQSLGIAGLSARATATRQTVTPVGQTSSATQLKDDQRLQLIYSREF
jgi:hypothetical protein